MSPPETTFHHHCTAVLRRCEFRSHHKPLVLIFIVLYLYIYIFVFLCFLFLFVLFLFCFTSLVFKEQHHVRVLRSLQKIIWNQNHQCSFIRTANSRPKQKENGHFQEPAMDDPKRYMTYQRVSGLQGSSRGSPGTPQTPSRHPRDPPGTPRGRPRTFKDLSEPPRGIPQQRPLTTRGHSRDTQELPKDRPGTITPLVQRLKTPHRPQSASQPILSTLHSSPDNESSGL